MESEIPQWVYNAAGEIEAAQDGDEGQSHYPIYHQQIAEIFMKHMRRKQPQGEATASDPLAKYARCDAVKRKAAQTEGGEKPLKLPTKDDPGDLEKFLNPNGVLRTPVGTVLGTCDEFSDQHPTFPECHNWKSLPAEPSSPPATAGTAREFVVEWAKRHKETYLQVDDIAACAEAYTAEQVRQADAWKKVAEERKKLADSLLDEVTQLRQERDALKAKVEALNG